MYESVADTSPSARGSGLPSSRLARLAHAVAKTACREAGVGRPGSCSKASPGREPPLAAHALASASISAWKVASPSSPSAGERDTPKLPSSSSAAAGTCCTMASTRWATESVETHTKPASAVSPAICPASSTTRASEEVVHSTRTRAPDWASGDSSRLATSAAAAAKAALGLFEER